MIEFKQGDSISLDIKFCHEIEDEVFVLFSGKDKKMSFSTEDGTIEKVSDTVYNIKFSNEDTIDLIGNYKIDLYLKNGKFGVNAVNTIDVVFYKSEVAKEAL